jgi:hypothetical protein
MSAQPEEIEEGEIEMTESELEEESELELEDEDFGESVDTATLMTSLLATEDGDTICTALVEIGQQLQTQNKILIKILSQLKN